jgi:hypothetical protein
MYLFDINQVVNTRLFHLQLNISISIKISFNYLKSLLHNEKINFFILIRH